MCRNNSELAAKYHLGIYVNGQWNCCGRYKSSHGCAATWTALDAAQKSLGYIGCHEHHYYNKSVSLIYIVMFLQETLIMTKPHL